MSDLISKSPPEGKGTIAVDLKTLEDFTGLTISPPSFPDWGALHKRELVDTCKVLASILILQQAATNQQNEEINLQKSARQLLSKVELDLVPRRPTEIRDHDLCAKSDELYPIMAKMQIRNVRNIISQLEKAGLVTTAHRYIESSSPELIGYKIPAPKIAASLELINKWGINGAK